MAFPINPPNAPLVNEKGLCSREWYLFFLNIQRLIGTSQTNPFDDSTLLGFAEINPEPPAPVYLLSVVEPGTLTAGGGLTGSGNMANNLTITVGAGLGITVNADDVQLDTAHVRNVDHSGVTLTAGAGLTGGGDISASRSFAVGAGTGITVNADDVAIDTGVVVTLTGSQTLTNKSLTAPTLTGIVLFTNGDSSATFTNPSARLGYSGTDDYAHFIHTRHNNSATLNAIDFYTSDGTQNGTFPTNAIHGFTIENTNLLIGTTTVTGSSQKTIHMANGTAPGSTPSGGGVLYVESGALKYIGSSGTTTTVAPA